MQSGATGIMTFASQDVSGNGANHCEILYYVGGFFKKMKIKRDFPTYNRAK